MTEDTMELLLANTITYYRIYAQGFGAFLFDAIVGNASSSAAVCLFALGSAAGEVRVLDEKCRWDMLIWCCEWAPSDETHIVRIDGGSKQICGDASIRVPDRQVLSPPLTEVWDDVSLH